MHPLIVTTIAFIYNAIELLEILFGTHLTASKRQDLHVKSSNTLQVKGKAHKDKAHYAVHSGPILLRTSGGYSLDYY